MVISYTAALDAPMLEFEQERMLIRTWQSQRDSASLETLIISHVRLVYAAARKSGASAHHLEDVLAEGMIGLIQAADRFDLTRDTRFSTFAYWCVRNAVTTSLARLRSIVDVPKGANGKTAPVIVAAGELGELEETLACDAPTPEESLVEKTYEAEVQRAVTRALRQLEPMDRDIVQSRNLRPEPECPDLLAARLGLTRDRLRQLERRALMRFKQVLLDNGAGRLPEVAL